jgi:DNA-binding NarL/FixJ family response regulator
VVQAAKPNSYLSIQTKGDGRGIIMAGGTLVVSRSVINHKYYKHRLESMGKKNVYVTAVDKDGLYSIINNMKPDLMIMGARFYQCSTPYRMGLIKKEFPQLNMAAVCFGEYPADLGMYFILNGVKSYFNMFEGIELFHAGLSKILDGKVYISDVVKERINMRKEFPMPARKLTPKLIEIIRCICNGFQKEEIADNLYLSVRTVAKYREDIYRCLNVRNGEELFRAALRLHIITEEELIFCHKNFSIKPLPEKITTRRRK